MRFQKRRRRGACLRVHAAPSATHFASRPGTGWTRETGEELVLPQCSPGGNTMLREVFWGGADDVRHAPNIPSDLSETSLRVLRVERAENCLSDPATCSEHALSLFLSQLSRWCPPSSATATQYQHAEKNAPNSRPVPHVTASYPLSGAKARRMLSTCFSPCQAPGRHLQSYSFSCSSSSCGPMTSRLLICSLFSSTFWPLFSTSESADSCSLPDS